MKSFKQFLTEKYAGANATIKCPACGKSVAANTTVCPFCDAHLPKETEADRVAWDKVPEAKKRPIDDGGAWASRWAK